MKKLVIVFVTLALALTLLVVNAGAALATDRGLTPGYWKNHEENWPSQMITTQTVGSLFGPACFTGDLAVLKNETLMTALQGFPDSKIKGPKTDSDMNVHKAQILLRAAVAAYINASTSSLSNTNPDSPKFGYPCTTTEVKDMTQDVLRKIDIIDKEVANGDHITITGSMMDNATWRDNMLALKDIFDGYNNLGL